jgi:hypothetical protein
VHNCVSVCVCVCVCQPYCKWRASENPIKMPGSDFCIPRDENARPFYFQNRIIMFCLPISTFLYLWAIYIFQDRSAYFAAAKQADRPWEYINHSQAQECRNWEQGRAVSFLGIHKSNFQYSAIKVEVGGGEGRYWSGILPYSWYQGMLALVFFFFMCTAR